MRQLLLFLSSIVLGLGSAREWRGGGHHREYILCARESGELYYYKGSHERRTQCDVDVARAKYSNTINQTGWAFVDVEIADDSIPEYMQGYAAGFVEGRASRDLIDPHIYNLFHDYCKGAEEYCNRLRTFSRANLDYMREQVNKHRDDSFWKQVNVTLSHMIGMIDGFSGDLISGINDHEAAVHGIFLLQLQAEIWDYEAKLGRPKELWTRRGHCSAIVKLTPGNSNLLFSHITWDSLSSMLRMQKRLTFKMDIPGKTYTYSGYPGTTASIDDFYLTSAQLAVFETTNEVYDNDIYVYTTTRTVPTWIRSQVATRLASTAEEWVSIFGQHNSGTYNNQWVVVDYKLFEPGMESLPPGLIYVLEQMPGSIEYADMTAHLDMKRYWPGYNKPYFTSTAHVSGCDKMREKYGDFYSHNATSRAKIFARDQHNVKDVASLRKLMRSNDYKHDPFSRCKGCKPEYNAQLAIASRADLNPANGQYPIPDLSMLDMVATDVKITDVELMETLSFDASVGPTHQSVPVFDWETSQLKDKVRHRSQPRRWEFKPVQHVWSQRSLYDD